MGYATFFAHRVWRTAIGVLAAMAALSACGERDDAPGVNVSIVLSGDEADHAKKGELTPRDELFGPPERYRGRLSPDGQKVSWLAPLDGVLNVWTAPADRPDDARPITAASRDVTYYNWAKNNTHIIFDQPLADGRGWRQFVVDTATGDVRDISPGDPDVSVHVVTQSWDYPGQIVLKANDRDRNLFDLHKVNIETGESERMFVNDQGFVHFHVDNALNLRLAETLNDDGDRVIHRRERDDSWRVVDTIPYEDSATSSFFAFDAANQSMFGFDSRGRDSTALMRIDVASWTSSVIAELSGVDIALPLMHPTTFELSAAMVVQLDSRWIAFTPRAQQAIAQLRQHFRNDSFMVLARTVDDRNWIVYEGGSDHPGRYHIFHLEKGVATPMFDVRPRLASRALAPKTSVVIEADDGLNLIAYLTLPPGADENGDGRPERRSPLVVLPQPHEHIGDEFDANAQWLADRGYAVLNVTVRGAKGLGKAFHAAGINPLNNEVLEDINTAAEWAVYKGVAEPDRIAVAGEGHGGLLALATLTIPQTNYSCAIASNAPSDLGALLLDPPPPWRPYAAELRRRFGDPNDPDDLARLRDHSPVGFAQDISAPFLYSIGELGQSPQVAGAEQTVAIARANGVPATLMTFAEEGAYLDRPDSIVAFAAAAELFLADCLGGAVEPTDQDLDLPGLTIDSDGGSLPRITASVAP